jgi:hypothetical protein
MIQMSKELHTAAISLAPGDFKILVDFMKSGNYEYATLSVSWDMCGLEMKNKDSRGVVSFDSGSAIEDLAKQFTWNVPVKALSRIADVIPADSFYWASQSLNTEMALDKYTSFIGYIKDSDWKKEQDLWVKDREYRRLTAQKEDIDSHLMQLFLELYDDKIEFWIDVNEVCAVIQSEIPCTATARE